MERYQNIIASFENIAWSIDRIETIEIGKMILVDKNIFAKN